MISEQFIETSDRVFRLWVTPDTPEPCTRILHVEVVSGPDLTEEELLEITKSFMADALARGIDVVGWSCPELED